MARLSGKRVAVVGASEGVGRALVTQARADGARVLAVARRPAPLAALAREEPGVLTAAIDATANDAAERLFAQMIPDLLVLSAGARPTMAAVQTQTWEQFSTNWNADVKAAFELCGAALRKPLPKGATVALISSGAGLAGSQLSGGYAGAKRMQMFLAEYAQDQSDRLGLEIRFLAIVPKRIMSSTGLGAAAAAGYSAYHGITPAEFVERMGNVQTPAQVAQAVIELATESPQREGNVFAVGADGIEVVP